MHDAVYISQLTIRYIILFLSLGGYIVFLNHKYNIKLEFAPALVFSSITALMYIAGLLNIMLHMAALLLVLGIALLGYSIIFKKFHIHFKKSISPGIIIFLTGCLTIVIVYSGARLIEYDNFSHWALIVKQLCRENRLPNFSDNLIYFKTYPPGSAVFIYFISKILGHTEGTMLIAQNFYLLSCVLCFVPLINKSKKLFSYLILLPASVFLLNFSVGTNGLQVDTLLPLIALANTLIIIYYSKNIIKASLLSIPFLTSILIVKNSGIFFAIIIVFLLILFFKHNIGNAQKDISKKEKSEKRLIVFGSILVPFILKFLWSRHVKMVFPVDTLLSGKHSLNPVHYRHMISGKTKADILDICQRFFEEITDIFSPGNLVMLIFNAVMIIAVIAFYLSYTNKCTVLRILILCDILYLVYQFSLLAMYLFSMPTGEAITLASYDRYNATMVVYIVGIGLYFILSKLSSIENNGLGAVLAFCLFFIISYGVFSFDLPRRMYPKLARDSSIVSALDESIKGIHNISDNEYVVYAPSSSNDFGYSHYLTRYSLYTDKITLMETCSDTKRFYESLKGKDYLIVLEVDSEITKLLNPLQKRDSYIGSYKCDDILQ